MSVDEISKRVHRVHQSTARFMPHVVHCPHCGRTEKVEPEEYLRSGRPKCCSQPMEFGATPVARTSRHL